MIRRSWPWAAAAAIAVPLYYVLSWGALERFLQRAARADAAQLVHGFRWDFDRRDDLAGPAPAAIARGRLDDSVLAVSQATVSDHVSLNLRGEEIDARVFTRLKLRIELERAVPALLFFREALDGPDYGSPPLPLDAGLQTLDLALDELSWRPHPGPADGAAQPWGGVSGTVASLRLHPVGSGRADFRLDWIALEPSGPGIAREVLTTSLDRAESAIAEFARPLLLVLNEPPLRLARVMELRRRIESRWPASSVLLRPPRDPSRPAIGSALIPLALSLTLGMAAAAARRRPGLAAALSLGAVGVAAAGLLLSPAGTGDAATVVLAAWLALLLLIHAVPSLREPGTAPLGTSAAWRQAALLTVVGLLPLLLAAGGEAPPVTEIGIRWLWYLPWAALQQLLLCAVLYPLCRRLPLSAATAAAGAALLFGLAHFPNFELMLGTLALAAVCLAFYRRHRAIAPLVVLHATLGTAYLGLLPGDLLFSGAVGMRYFG